MTTQQVPPTLSDRKLWGRMVDGYAKAWGTGARHFDPEGNDVKVYGSIWMLMPLEEYQVRDIWKGCGLNTTHPQSVWHRLSDFDQRYIQLDGLKMRKGFWAGEVWAGTLAFIMDREQVNAGWIAAKDIPRLFEKFDRWTDGKVKSLENVTIAVSSV